MPVSTCSRTELRRSNSTYVEGSQKYLGCWNPAFGTGRGWAIETRCSPRVTTPNFVAVGQTV